ncbi:uncharacterized protein C1orf115-like [Gadus morhua]|uniref:uncharacterized protein C1orf115-like n=1 Tax=Gadus morhua TaxID=8049 RepID=UPI0011B5F744|nr:uncharacterized protein C1orf115-like [Gadus morhua]XP_056438040.1 required for drug-induced death protein 1-like [Gadus chalcogrammus]
MKPTSFATRLFHRNVESLGVRAASYERQVDGANLQGSHAPPDSLQKETSRQPDRGLRDVHLAFLPERYQPLVDKEAEQEAKEARKLKKKEKYKKVKKRAGRAWRGSWKCLMLGLHNFALAYTTPLTAAATCFIPEFQPGRG